MKIDVWKAAEIKLDFGKKKKVDTNKTTEYNTTHETAIMVTSWSTGQGKVSSSNFPRQKSQLAEMGEIKVALH